MSVAAIVPAAGSGLRLGAGMPKAFVPLAGTPIVVRTVAGLLASGVVEEVLVAVPGPFVEPARRLLAGCPAIVLEGGAERTATVRSALDLLCGARIGGAPGYHRELEDVPNVVLVHDAARPLTPPALVASVVEAVRAGHPAVVPVLPVTDTVKRVLATGATAECTVECTVDRAPLRSAQTPQGFALAALRAAYDRSDVAADATDDAGLVERIGEPVLTIMGDPAAFKITTQWDRRLAELLLERST